MCVKGVTMCVKGVTMCVKRGSHRSIHPPTLPTGAQALLLKFRKPRVDYLPEDFDASAFICPGAGCNLMATPLL
jgi:hypothetical protein